MPRSSFTLAIISALLTPILVLSISISSAQVMTSSNYQMESDSINIGGGLSSSTNYALESTVGEVATGPTESTSYKLRGGYQQMNEVYIAMSVSSSSVGLSPSIPGLSGGTANGSTSVSVTTDSLAGYQLTIHSSSNPSMQKGADSIADYTPAGGNPDFTFTTAAADSHVGYTPEGSDVVQRFLDNGAICNTDSGNTASSCWDGLSTTPEVIAQGSGSNHPSGTQTSVRFRVGVGGSVAQAPGEYTATTTLTALAL
jgi:hypothetical protein